MSSVEEQEHFRRVYHGDETCNQVGHKHNVKDILVLPKPGIGRHFQVLLEALLLASGFVGAVLALLHAIHTTQWVSLTWIGIYLVMTGLTQLGISELSKGN